MKYHERIKINIRNEFVCVHPLNTDKNTKNREIGLITAEKIILQLGLI